MGLLKANYNDIRAKVGTGDIIAFSGCGYFSELIRVATRSAVSHVGLVISVTPQGSSNDFNLLAESIFKEGVRMINLSQKLKSDDLAVWWLPLSNSSREHLNINTMTEWLLRNEHKPYDMEQVMQSAVDDNDRSPIRSTYNIEDFSQFFCSELISGALEAGGLIKSINASEVTPADLCMFNLYANDYFQLKGKDCAIGGFNSISPEGWGII